MCSSRLFAAALLLAGSGRALATADDPSSAPGVVALVGATAINPAKAEVIPDAVVLLAGGRVQAVGAAKDVPVPPGAERRDLHGKWVLPGYTDAHIHFFQSGGLYTRPDSLDLNKVYPYADEVAWIKAHVADTFSRYLACGITAVVDVGGPMWNFEVRERARTGREPAPQVAVAGPLISSVDDKPLDLGDPPILKITDPEAARAEVRRQAAFKPDLIKVWYIVQPDKGLTVESYRPVMRAVAEEAHSLGLRVAVHATELESARAAVQEGADVLVHMVSDVPVDDEFVQLLREKKIVIIPTLGVHGRYFYTFMACPNLVAAELRTANPEVVGSLTDTRQLPPEVLPPPLRKILEGPDPAQIAEQRVSFFQRASLPNLKKLQDAGVLVAAGTDAGNCGTLHGPGLFYEFSLMAKAGLTPMQILTSATAGGAHVFSAQPDFGELAAGQRADLVVLDADPLADIANAARVHTVIQGGRFLNPAELLHETPAELVQRQVNAYNSRNLDAFLETYADDARIVSPGAEPPGQAIKEGAVRGTYAHLFQQNPKLHCQILERKVEGNTVTDHERVTGLDGGKVIEGTATYQVSEGRIESVRLMPN